MDADVGESGSSDGGSEEVIEEAVGVGAVWSQLRRRLKRSRATDDCSEGGETGGGGRGDSAGIWGFCFWR